MNQVRRRAEAILQLQGFLQEIHYFRGGAVTVLANKNTWVVEADNGRGKWVMNPNRPAFLPDFHALIALHSHRICSEPTQNRIPDKTTRASVTGLPLELLPSRRHSRRG